MKNTKCNISDFLNMVQSVIRMDAKNMHTVQIVLRNMDKSAMAHKFLNHYGIVATQNGCGFIVNTSYKMSMPAQKIMDVLCRMRGDVRATSTGDKFISERFMRDFDLLNPSERKTYRDISASKLTVSAMQMRFVKDMSISK